MCFRLWTSNLDSASSDPIMGGLNLICFLLKAQFILRITSEQPQQADCEENELQDASKTSGKFILLSY